MRHFLSSFEIEATIRKLGKCCLGRKRKEKVMKVVFDIDGTLTDYNRFVHKRAVRYFMRKYNMQVANPCALEIEDVFEIKTTFLNQGLAEAKAENKVSRMLNRFWFSKNCVYFFAARFRKGVASYIRRLRKDGYEVEFHTSRAKSCSLGLIENPCDS